MVWKPFRPKEPIAEPIEEIKEVVKPEPVIKKQVQEEGLTEEDLIKALTEQRNIELNHEARIQSLEAALYRLKALV